MKKLYFLLIIALQLSAFNKAEAKVQQISISAAEIRPDGYVVKKIWLEHYTLPTIRTVAENWTDAPAASLSLLSSLPKDYPANGLADMEVKLGKDLNRPFALLFIPCCKKDAAGHWLQLSTANMTIAEADAPPAAAAKKTSAATASVLTTGTWRRLAVAERGIYKVDYAMLSGFPGFSGAGLSSDAIRLYGNGGAMLSEDNAAERPDDLVQNAIDMHDGGDGTFDAGDYFLFYADATTAWALQQGTALFAATKNLYADSNYFFLTIRPEGAPVRTAIAAQPAGTPTVAVSNFNAYATHENDEENPGKFGKLWWGDRMSTAQSGSLTRSITFQFPAPPDTIRAETYFAVRSSTGGSTIGITANGQALGTYSFAGVVVDDDNVPLSVESASYTLPGNGAAATTFTYTLTASAMDALGYIDHLTVNARCALRYSNGQLSFRDLRSVGPGSIAGFQVQNAGGDLQVWDVSDPLKPALVQGSVTGSNFTFKADASVLHEYMATGSTDYKTPADAGAVANQNLHGLPQADLLIITPPAFRAPAEDLAAHHRSHDAMRVNVATTDDIYNEFSSGRQDISALRDFARMFYQRAGTDSTEMPKNILLFGDASYDYKNRISGNSNFVPTFESAESINNQTTFVNDDFFAFLDDNENIENLSIANTLDAGIGRIPSQTVAEAEGVVNKIKIYASPAALGPWRLSNTYVGDNEDNAGNHLNDAEAMAATVNARSHLFNDTKIYLDAIDFVSTPGGSRAPQANKALNDQIYKGTSLINYSGHGNPTTLAHERILTVDDYTNWHNLTQLPFMITATCDFSRFDRPAATSAGERIVMKGDGGAIAMLTTTQLAYAGSNGVINGAFLNNQYKQRDNGQWYTFGQAFRKAKNQVYVNPGPGAIVYRAFTLLGDPAIQPAFPRYSVVTDSVMDIKSGRATDSLSALGGYEVRGSIRDKDGALLSDFNGQVTVTVFDKPRTVTVVTKFHHYTQHYNLQDNIIYKGTATATGGLFALSFIAPKDLNYDFGKGRISYYAENGETDGAGVDTSVSVGGSAAIPFTDNDAPLVRPFIDDSTFRDGSITGANTLLYVRLSDETGINVTGTSVGHDLIAVLDGNEAAPYILNDYYETFPNNYREGVVKFPLAGISAGHHTITVRAWDVSNNSGDGAISFEVIDGTVIQVNDLMNYPNPFSDITHFVFKHNHPGEALTAQVMIYNTAGQQVRLLKQTFTPGTSSSGELTWDGTGNDGEKLPAGVYPYRMVLIAPGGATGAAYQKAVLVR